ncbi:MAG: hypothetical protein ABIK09_00740 [Pseudomonadota bacterium]
MRTVVLSTLLLCIACAEPAGTETARAPLEMSEASFTVPWDALGRFGHTGAGPRSLACLDDGVALLDAGGQRVLRFSAEGALLGETPVPVLADDFISVGGGWVFLSGPSRQVVLTDADGSSRETIPLPEGLAPVTALGLEDGDLTVTNAYQDSLALRTPTLAAIREGIPCGDGLRCQLISDHPVAPAALRGFRLRVASVPRAEGDGLRFEDGGLLPVSASAARLVGLDGDALLVLADTVAEDGAVRRELLWVDPDMGLNRRVEIAVRGGAVPFRQVAPCPGGGAAWMQEVDDGIRVIRLSPWGGAR